MIGFVPPLVEPGQGQAGGAGRDQVVRDVMHEGLNRHRLLPVLKAGSSALVLPERVQFAHEKSTVLNQGSRRL